MNIIELPLTIMFFAILSVPLAVRLRIPLEIFLLIASGIISLWPGLPSIEIKPYVVFYLFLPPILFSAAYFTSWHEFKLNKRPIFLLAFGLVIVTALVVASVAHCCFPGFTWAEGFLLGAIISPTDASAATVLIKKLGAPRRLIAILEGESLINDATALIFFRFSLIAIITGSFSLPEAMGNFIFISVGGIFIGLTLGIVGVFLMKKLHDVQAETTFTFIIAMACYAVAEHFQCSGVIATVSGGIYFGIMVPALAHSKTRLSARLSWNTLLFIINVSVFTLIGLKLSWVLRNLGKSNAIDLLLYGIFLSIVIILVRMIWVFLMAYLSRQFAHSHNQHAQTLSPAMLFILGWSGMRGIVSFAAVLAIPTALGADFFPHRQEFIFITYCVIVITLILPTLSLPFLLKYYQLTDQENELKQEAIARLQTLKDVMVQIAETARKEKISDEVYQDFLKHIEDRIGVIRTQFADVPYSSLPPDFFMMRKLLIVAIARERTTLLQLRKAGKIHESVFRKLTDELDLEEVRVHTLRI